MILVFTLPLTEMSTNGSTLCIVLLMQGIQITVVTHTYFEDLLFLKFLSLGHLFIFNLLNYTIATAATTTTTKLN
jgi:hypothetical protein